MNGQIPPRRNPGPLPVILGAEQVNEPGAYWWRRTSAHDWYVVNVAKILTSSSSELLGFLEPWVIAGPVRLHGEFVGPLPVPAVTTNSDPRTEAIRLAKDWASHTEFAKEIGMLGPSPDALIKALTRLEEAL